MCAAVFAPGLRMNIRHLPNVLRSKCRSAARSFSTTMFECDANTQPKKKKNIFRTERCRAIFVIGARRGEPSTPVAIWVGGGGLWICFGGDEVED